MSSTIDIKLDNDQTERIKALQRLRTRRARGRRSEVLVGAHFLELKKRGYITSAEFDFVMGITDTLEPEPKNKGGKP